MGASTAFRWKRSPAADAAAVASAMTESREASGGGGVDQKLARQPGGKREVRCEGGDASGRSAHWMMRPASRASPAAEEVAEDGRRGRWWMRRRSTGAVLEGQEVASPGGGRCGCGGGIRESAARC